MVLLQRLLLLTILVNNGYGFADLMSCTLCQTVVGIVEQTIDYGADTADIDMTSVCQLTFVLKQACLTLVHDFLRVIVAGAKDGMTSTDICGLVNPACKEHKTVLHHLQVREVHSVVAHHGGMRRKRQADEFHDVGRMTKEQIGEILAGDNAAVRDWLRGHGLLAANFNCRTQGCQKRMAEGSYREWWRWSCIKCPGTVNNANVRHVLGYKTLESRTLEATKPKPKLNCCFNFML